MADIQSGNDEMSNDDTDETIIRATNQYREEAYQNRIVRIEQDRLNWDIYNLNQDFSDKRPGQSREFLPRQAMAVEQITQFFQQGIIDIGDFWRAEYAPGVIPAELPITNAEIQKIVNYYLERVYEGKGFIGFTGDAVKTGLLASNLIAKVYGSMAKKPFYTFTQRMVGEGENTHIKTDLKRGMKDIWQCELDLVQPYEFFEDPSGKRLYEMQEIFLDYFEVLRMASGPDAIYDKDMVESLDRQSAEDWEYQLNKARETNEPLPTRQRKKIKLLECWGSILEPTTGELLYENVVWTVANDAWLIQKPVPNPFWHGESPFIKTPIISIPKSTQNKALMDAPTSLNIAQNDLYNLILDSALMAVYGIKQYRPDWMQDDSSAAEGFLAGQSVAVNSKCPPGAKFMEPVQTGTMSQEALNVFNMTSAEFNSAALTNDLRMGVLPARSVKATEVVEASNSITSVFTGLAKVLEVNFIEKIIAKMWKVILQNADNLDSPAMQAILGKDRALEIAALSAQERFARCIDGTVFQVFGVSKVLAKMKDFRKLTAMLQTISSSPILIQEFSSEYSMQKLLAEIMKSLDIDTTKLEMNPQEKMESQQRMQQAMQMHQQMNAGGNVGQQGAGQPGQNGVGADQSQIPQSAAGSMHQTASSMIPSQAQGK